MAGQPKKFSKTEFENYVFDYFDMIYNSQTDDDSTDIPTFYGFYRYVSEMKDCSYHTIRRCFDEYWANIKTDFENIRADLLVRGGSLGKYNTAMIIFALKNWCKWKDSPAEEEKQDNKIEIVLKRE